MTKIKTLIKKHNNMCIVKTDIEKDETNSDEFGMTYVQCCINIKSIKEDIIERLEIFIDDLRSYLLQYAIVNKKLRSNNISDEDDNDLLTEQEEIKSMIYEGIELVDTDISWYESMLNVNDYHYLNIWLERYKEEYL